MDLPVQIVATGQYLPQRVVESAEVEAWCGLPVGWAFRRNGVMRRHWVNPEHETNAYMGAQAAAMALEVAGVAPHEVDLILNASGSAQQPIPDNAPLLQAALGLEKSGIPCFSVHATCLSFIAGLEVAAHLMQGGRYSKVLLISSEIGSVGLNPQEPESATLIGDGAAAVLLQPAPAGSASALHAVRLETYAEGAHHTQIVGGGTFRPPNHPQATAQDFMFHMEGPKVLRMARQHAAGFLERLQVGLSQHLGNIERVVPHQASLVGLKLLGQFGWPPERIEQTLPHLGNCIAASIPLTLHQAIASGRLQRGQKVLLVGTGAGFSMGGAILTY